MYTLFFLFSIVSFELSIILSSHIVIVIVSIIVIDIYSHKSSNFYKQQYFLQKVTSVCFSMKISNCFVNIHCAYMHLLLSTSIEFTSLSSIVWHCACIIMVFCYWRICILTYLYCVCLFCNLLRVLTYK